jgi:hypothetical protein
LGRQPPAAGPLQLLDPHPIADRPPGRLRHPQRAGRLLILLAVEECRKVPHPIKQRRDRHQLIVAAGAARGLGQEVAVERVIAVREKVCCRRLPRCVT